MRVLGGGLRQRAVADMTHAAIRVCIFRGPVFRQVALSVSTALLTHRGTDSALARVAVSIVLK